MDEEEQNHYVSQLREVFDSCDTTGTGYLDKEELSELCHKLHLEPHLPVILSTLLGPGHYARVNFEEFKEGFVAVLSHSLELSTSEEESSYLEPVLAEEVKPKYVKGTKRYGRRSRPEARGSEVEIAEDPETPGPRAARAEPFSWGARAEQLRRSASLESVESLKSDEETASNKEAYNETFESQGQSRRWKPDAVSSLRQTPGPRDVTDGQMKTIWDELGVGGSGYLSRQELSLVCDSMGLSGLQSEELDALFARLDKDRDGRVSLKEFQEGLFRHAPLSAPTTSTPIKPQQRGSLSQALEDSASRSARPSVLSTTVGPRLLSCLDDGSGGASPEQVIGIWSSEGIRNGKDILQILEFPLDEKLSLAELTLALDNELLSSANGIHQAALISYKSEIQFLHVQAEQACKERDKLKADLERAEKRNLQLVREVDDRHAAMESLNESKIKDLEQDYRDKLSAIRSDLERENELLWQQANQQKAKLEEDLATLRAEDTSLRADVTAAAEENSHLEKEVNELRKKLSESEKTISKLQKDLDNLLMSKFGALDPQGCGLLGQEERFAEIIKEYELQCRKVKELRDRNDELHTELEILRGQVTDRRSRHRQDTGSSHPRAAGRAALTDSGPISPEKDPENMSIETELAVQQLKEKHQQEVQDLKIQLETKVNFYERSIELMKRNMEVERKDIEQGFKMEISELEEQKRQLEEKSERLQEAMAGLRAPLPSWGPEHDKRLLRERAELEQSYAKEISHLVQSLTAEKEQLEEELTQKLERELQQMRAELDRLTSENSTLKDRLSALQQDSQKLEVDVNRKRKQLEQMTSEKETIQAKSELISQENTRCREEMMDLSNRNLQLSSENAELTSQIRAEQSAIQLLSERLAEASRQTGEEAAVAGQLREAVARLEGEQAGWQRQRELMEQELRAAREKLSRLRDLESELSSLALKHQWLEQDRQRLLEEAEERNRKMEKLQASLQALDSQTEQLHSELRAAGRDKTRLAQDAAASQEMLQEAKDKVQELEASVQRLCHEKEQLEISHRQREQQEVLSLRREHQALRSQHEELLQKVELLQAREAELTQVTQECQALKSKQAELEAELQESQDQLLQAGAALVLARSQHAREAQQLRERAGAALSREQEAELRARLAEEHRRGQQLQEQLRAQVEQASTQMGLQQEHYETVLKRTEERMKEVELKLKTLRELLQEKVEQLKEQLAKNAKSDVLLKDLYVENSQLMKALQVTEQRQKTVEKTNFVLEEKIAALNRLLRKIAPATLMA
nr:PREDICTED: ninein-like protein isoform X5 [Lepisosteus oculatus]